jgi:hypothetical protein
MARGDERQRVADAARGLEPIAERDGRWAHLTLCVLDAVFSIGTRYRGTCRTVHSYAQLEGLSHVLEPADQVAGGAFAAGEQPVSALRDRVGRDGPEEFARQVRNRQRTSSRGGILKADAAGRYAAVLADHAVERLADVTELLTDLARVEKVEAELAAVPGHGQHGIRTSYLWMLAGDDQHVKPDRMVLGWLAGVLHRTPAVPEATELVTAAASELGVTPWRLDHAIWAAQRSRRGRS